MPKIQLDKQLFFSLLGKTMNKDELENALVVAKAELEYFEEDDATIKIELNDTNRPDLWSGAGLARQLRSFFTYSIPSFPFYNVAPPQDKVIHVDNALKDIRPYIVGFEILGKQVDEVLLVELIQHQEKLCENFGQKRSAVAMGIYCSNKIQWPLHYKASDPDVTKFIPLEFSRSLSLREILNEHQKGKEYKHLIEDKSLFPLLIDSSGEVLSMPPVINSANLGTIKVGDSSFFVEFTGWNMDMLLLVASICSCDYAEMGFTVTRVMSLYDYETSYSKKVACPHNFQRTKEFSITQANILLGKEHSEEEIIQALLRMGIQSTKTADDIISIDIPTYRNDFLHEVDVIEDIMIGSGLSSYTPEMPKNFTVGRVTKKEICKRNILQTMVGLGFQEMMFPYLGSKQQHIINMYEENEILEKEKTFAKVINPISENYEYVRQSILPNLLETEQVSANTVYPHKICEVGEVVVKDGNENHGFRTQQILGFLFANTQASFTDINSIVAAILYYYNIDWHTESVQDSRFIDNRVALARRKSDKVILGFFGEIHPRVLDNFEITMPCAVGELFLDTLII